jgi:GTP1/Obg family GTP-binding protein
MSEEIDRRDYGRMEAQVEQLTKDVHTLKETVETMRDMMQQAKGGWRTLMFLAGIAGSVGAMLSWILAHMKWG